MPDTRPHLARLAKRNRRSLGDLEAARRRLYRALEVAEACMMDAAAKRYRPGIKTVPGYFRDWSRRNDWVEPADVERYDRLTAEGFDVLTVRIVRHPSPRREP